MRPLTTPPFEFRTTVYSRSNGDSACAKAAYRSASLIVDLRTGRVWDFRAKEAVVATGILAPEGAPAWCEDRAELWNRAELAEGTRKNAQIAREVRLTLPRDLSLEQMRSVVEQHIKGAYIHHGMIADYAIHAPDARDGEEHFHAHILLTQRQLDSSSASGFAAKKGGANFNEVFADEFKNGAAGKFAAGDEKVTQLRAAWADQLNIALEAAGSRVRVDHRTNAEQREEALIKAADPRLSAEERDWHEARADILSIPPEGKLGNKPGGRRRAEIEKLRAERAAKVRHWEAELARRAEARDRNPSHHKKEITDEYQHRPQRAAARSFAISLEKAKSVREMPRHRDGVQLVQQLPLATGTRRHADRLLLGDALDRLPGRNPWNRRSLQGERKPVPGASGRTDPRIRKSDTSKDAAERRQRRQQAAQAARAGMDKITDPAAVRTQERADRYKLQLIAQVYRQKLPQDLARDLAWVRDRKTELVVQTKAGARIHDDGKMLSLDGRRDPAAVRLAVQMARAKGWNSIELNGSNQFRLAAAEAATRAGIKVTNAELRQHVQQIRERMAEEARPKLGVRQDQLTWLRQHVAAIKARQAEIQPKLPVPTWTAPTGQERPLYVTRDVGGMRVRVKDQLTPEQIRAQLQPTWEQAKARLKLAEQKVENMEQAIKNAGFIGAIKMGLTEMKAAKEADAALKRASKTVEDLDEQWRQSGKPKWEFERAIDRAWNEGEGDHKHLEKLMDKLQGSLSVPSHLIEVLERLESAGIQLDPPEPGNDTSPTHTPGESAEKQLMRLEAAVRQAEERTREITEKWEAEQLAIQGDDQRQVRRRGLSPLSPKPGP